MAKYHDQFLQISNKNVPQVPTIMFVKRALRPSLYPQSFLPYDVKLGPHRVANHKQDTVSQEQKYHHGQSFENIIYYNMHALNVSALKSLMHIFDISTILINLLLTYLLFVTQMFKTIQLCILEMYLLSRDIIFYKSIFILYRL